MFDPVSLSDLLGACGKDNLFEGLHSWIVRRKNESERTPGIVSRILMGNGRKRPVNHVARWVGFDGGRTQGLG